MLKALVYLFRVASGISTWLPTCFMAKYLVRKDHPWYRRKFLLADWSERRTSVCKRFDALFWVYGLCLLIALIHGLATLYRAGG